MKKKLVAVIVNYNSYKDCLNCVNSLLDNEIVGEDAICIVDNKSPDGSGNALARSLSKVKVILKEKNDGFSAGVNAGVKAIDAEIYLVLNPDTYFQDNNMKIIFDLFSSQPSLGLIGLKLVYPDGQLQYSARRFYSWFSVLVRRSPLLRLKPLRMYVDQHLMVGAWKSDSFETDWVIGTGFTVRKTALDAVGGMDEGYFLYLEDTDLCRRLWKGGWQVKATSQVTLVHAHQRASARKLFSRSSRAHLSSLFRYWYKFGMPLFGHGSRN